MTEETLLAILQEELYPEPYPEITPPPGRISKLLMRPSGGGARYVLAVSPWKQETTALAELGGIRRCVGAALDASLFRGVGLIVLWHGPRNDWQSAAGELSPDKIGLRSTIVQGIIFVDLDTGDIHTRRSSWGPIKFGNFQGQFTRINEVLERTFGAKRD